MRARGWLGHGRLVRAQLGLVLLAALCLAPLLALPAAADPTFPPLTGRVVDDAHLLSPSDQAALTAELKALEDKSSDQLVVVTLPNLQGYSIADYGYRLGRHWGIGTKKLNNGVLLIVAPKEHKVRIEVGYGLEPVLTDAMSSIIIDNAILPQFRKGNYPQGIRDGVGDIIKTLEGDASEVAQRAKARRSETKPGVDWITVLVWILILLWVVYSFRRAARPGMAGRRGYPVILPGPGWGGGRGSSGGGFGGGFSGGGGSFGGGGASGSW